jgi:hypothetical protein
MLFINYFIVGQTSVKQSACFHNLYNYFDFHCIVLWNAQNFLISSHCCKWINDCFNSSQLCFDNECMRCVENYRCNTTQHKCDYFECNQQIDCQVFDDNKAIFLKI